jgi:hypothetical protein
LLKELSIRGQIIFILYIILVTIGGGGNSKCDKDKEQEQIEPPPPPPNLRNEILSAMMIRIQFPVQWINRGPGSPGNPVIFAADGNVETGGLGYGWALDDYEEFQENLYTGMPSFPLTLWSEYLCGPYDVTGNGIHRPGGRIYAALEICQYFPPYRNPCYEPDMMPGTLECSWEWTGAMCYSMVYYALVEADPTLNKVIYKNEGAQLMMERLLNSGRATEVDHNYIAAGDLIFMDIDHDGEYWDHVAVVSYADPWGIFDNDRCYGIIGYYSYPFRYRASEASMDEHNDAIENEWEYYYNNPWLLTEEYAKYLTVWAE